ncbi:hypothetical protein HNW77_14385 [Komagataeibacter sp. AV436]|uniref:Ribosomal RNA methyltransferase FtsJ domain-containing protein n=1 Tax=Komagataeibacter melomenusus TaxID=2766578 RepID=A0ABX2AGV1_9PROT|nr:SAM-dependent methyltransferase [Komagataeibacter melomenusus]MBV1831429.1 hypothetical protein [Komagataeibacter melomenusus]NPC67549.1 hypothetical protein [Komagataeibacter melomenusus]
MTARPEAGTQPAWPVRSAYLAAPGFDAVMEQELARKGAGDLCWHGRLALSALPPVASLWAIDIWDAPERHAVPSIKGAARIMRGLQRNWAGYAPAMHRRSALITDALPPVRPKPVSFPSTPPDAHLGGWTLLAPDVLLLSPTKSTPFINGEVAFVENRTDPPSRAYLKLWEALYRLGRWPVAGETCIDLGACPGGWTWVAASQGAHVTAIDRAPLAGSIAALPNVTCRYESAFGLDPATCEPVDWLFSDIIAYPTRLLALAQRWITSGRAARIVMTIKFQGETDHDTAEAFAAIPGGRVLHLWHNKHELTFFWQRDGA